MEGEMSSAKGSIGDWVVREYPHTRSITTMWHRAETFVNDLPTTTCGHELKKTVSSGGENYLIYVPEAQIGSDLAGMRGLKYSGHYFCGTCLKSQ
jgi:hypothetical protein